MTAPVRDTEEWYPSRICVFCDTCGIKEVHDYLISDAMNKLARLQVARNHLSKNEGWSCTADGDYCLNCRPFAALLHEAAQRLRDVAPDLHARNSPVAGIADGVADWLDQVAALHERNEPGHANVIQPGCQWCADEDFPCSDMRHALNVARVTLGGKREKTDGE